MTCVLSWYSICLPFFSQCYVMLNGLLLILFICHLEFPLTLPLTTLTSRSLFNVIQIKLVLFLAKQIRFGVLNSSFNGNRTVLCKLNLSVRFSVALLPKPAPKGGGDCVFWPSLFCTKTWILAMKTLGVSSRRLLQICNLMLTFTPFSTKG